MDRLRAGGLDALAGDAELVTSELVTNALLHAGSPAEVLLHVAPPRARVEVRDRSALAPVRPRQGAEAMTGRGLALVEGLARAWGVTPVGDGKVVWAELEVGHEGEVDLDPEALVAMWTEDALTEQPPRPETHTVRLGDVPIDLLLAAKSHVDDLVREFTLAASGASSGATAQVPAHLAELIEVVVHRFSEARQAIKRQALAAHERGDDHVELELRLPASAADAGEEYLRALDEADGYCRAARLLTLESPPQHRVFRHWYVEELIDQLRRAARGESTAPTETFERRLLREIDRMAETERQGARARRLYDLATGLAAAVTPEAVAQAALHEGVNALGASGGAVMLVSPRRTLSVPGAVGYDAQVVARLREESPAAELPAATALRTGKAVWLESRAERDARFPELVGFEPRTVSMLAVPIEAGGRRLGAMRFSFTEARLFDQEERSFVRAIAAQAGQALERARLWAARGEAARQLQRGLLPPTLPRVAGLEIAAAYRPLTESLDVGGDFYDVWEPGDGRVALAIGDVCGHGPEAAATTGLIRHTLRALTMSSGDLRTILRQLHRALVAALPSGDAVSTVAFGLLTPSDEGGRLELGTGGHAGPVVVRADGSARVVELGGALLGALGDPEVEVRRLDLAPGDEVVLFTDGATDARDARGRRFGAEGVRDAILAARAAGTPTPAAVTDAVLGHAGGTLHDDLAVLSVRWTGR